jgi:hypothetical protein
MTPFYSIDDGTEEGIKLNKKKMKGSTSRMVTPTTTMMTMMTTTTMMMTMTRTVMRMTRRRLVTKTRKTSIVIQLQGFFKG